MSASEDDVWFLGNNYINPISRKVTFFHWNGRSFQRFPDLVLSREGMIESLTIGGATAISGDDIWAVGSASSQERLQVFTVHWNGVVWESVPIVDLDLPAQYVLDLNDVSGTGAGDVWAVGRYGTSTIRDQALVLRWSGTAWESVPVPTSGTAFSELLDVEAFSASEVWAIGYQASPSGDLGASRPLVVHWNGTRWEEANAPEEFTELRALTLSSDGKIWVTGNSGDIAMSAVGIQSGQKVTWRNIAMTNVSAPTHLDALQALPNGDVWAFGTTWYDKSADDGAAHAIAFRFDGSVWQKESFPTPLYTQSIFNVSASRTGDLWVVGSYYDNVDDTPGYPLATRMRPCP